MEDKEERERRVNVGEKIRTEYLHRLNKNQNFNFVLAVVSRFVYFISISPEIKRVSFADNCDYFIDLSIKIYCVFELVTYCYVKL